MSNALAAQGTFNWTEEQIQTIKNTVAKGATNDELAMFLHVSQTYGLDPFLREIQLLKSKTGQLIIYTTRDGYLKIAHREKEEFEGIQSDVLRKGDVFKKVGTEIHHEYGQDRGAILGAWAIVYRKSKRIPFYFFAPFSEYYKAGADNWKTYASAMIQKVAEAMCLKRAFAISLVTQEELGYNANQDTLSIPEKKEDVVDAEFTEKEKDKAEAHALRDKCQAAAEKQSAKSESTPTNGKDPKITIWQRFLSYYKTKENAAEMIQRVIGDKPSKDWDDEDLSKMIDHMNDVEGMQRKLFEEAEAVADEKGIPKDDPQKEPSALEKSKAKMAREETEILKEKMHEMFRVHIGLTESEFIAWLKKNFVVAAISQLTKEKVKQAMKMGEAVLKAREEAKNLEDKTGGLR